MDVRSVDTSKCVVWDMHSRLVESLDDDGCAEMIRSVRLHGQKRPALGRRVTRGDGYEIELIYGARRLFAAQQLRIQLLVEVRDIDDQAAMIEMDVENRIRTDISAYERGLTYARSLRRSLFSTQAEMAKALGISEAKLSRLLRYAELPATVVGAFSSPLDIREDWAGALAKASANSTTRERLTQKARDLRRSPLQLRSAEAVFESLIHAGRDKNAYVKCKERDEVVKNQEGTPLFRVGIRLNTVHFVFSRERVTPDLLRELTSVVTDAVVAFDSKRTSGPSIVDRRGALLSSNGSAHKEFTKSTSAM